MFISESCMVTDMNRLMVVLARWWMRTVRNVGKQEVTITKPGKTGTSKPGVKWHSFIQSLLQESEFPCCCKTGKTLVKSFSTFSSCIPQSIVSLSSGHAHKLSFQWLIWQNNGYLLLLLLFRHQRPRWSILLDEHHQASPTLPVRAGFSTSHIPGR